MGFLCVQGLGGLHQCDDLATHDSEYNEIFMIHTHVGVLTPSIILLLYKLSVCFQTRNSELLSSAFTLANCDVQTNVRACLWIYFFCVCLNWSGDVCITDLTDVAESQIIHHVSREEGSPEE